MKKIQFRPYLIEAYIKWMEDSGLKPYITALYEEGKYPKWLEGYCEPTGYLIFNISRQVIKGLQVDEAGVSFDASFDGSKRTIFMPLDTIKALSSYGLDVILSLSEEVEPPTVKTKKEESVEEKKKPALRLVK